MWNDWPCDALSPDDAIAPLPPPLLRPPSLNLMLHLVQTRARTGQGMPVRAAAWQSCVASHVSPFPPLESYARCEVPGVRCDCAASEEGVQAMGAKMEEKQQPRDRIA